MERNLEIVQALQRIADGNGASVPQVGIAWVLSRGDRIVPLVGARTRERLAESVGVVDVTSAFGRAAQQQLATASGSSDLGGQICVLRFAY